MRAHMSRFHPGEAAWAKDERLKPVIPPNQRILHEVARLAPSSERAKKITKCISYFIAKDMRPYSVVENTGFRYMVHSLEPRYVIPSQSFFTLKSIPNLYKETKLSVQESLNSAHRVAITWDAWTSKATVSYMTVTAHYVSSKWKLMSYVLQTRAMDDSHTGANMCEFLKAMADEWGIEKHDLVLVTDNASNMSLAAELGNFLHVQCYAHTLNIACQRALKLPTVARLLGRVRRITAFFHRSTTASHVLEQKQALLELPKHKLKTDAPTRWNSGFDMVERFLEQQPAVCAVLLSPQVRKGAHDICTLSEADVSGAEHLVTALKPMKLATTTMSEESIPTLSVIAPLHAQLLANFTTASEDDPMTREVVRQEAHMPEEEGDNMAETHDESEDDVVEEFRVQGPELEEAGSSTPLTPSTPSTLRPSSLTALLGQTFSAVTTVKPKSVQIRVEEEVRRYLEAPSLPLTDNPLEWWRSNNLMYPRLAKLAKRYLCIPGTSTAAERVFSTAGDIVSAQRSMLTPQHVDQLVFLHKNLVVPEQ
ncbi:E3 SUMO-protein ligase ZBED1-like [Pagrus major]|uniref:E3 SUMO-protein ligase ZBED1-like n=1 Tax=Pagrus major TaxID=143350 RepID=UPI003CC83C68